MCIHYITDMSLCNKGKMLDTVILSQHVLSATFEYKMCGQIIMSLSGALKTQCEIKNNVFISAQCPGSEDGKYRHPTSCRHYFECVDMGTENTQVFTRECPRSNRFFNPFLQRCMWLPSGNCNQRGTATTSPPLTCTLPSEGWHVFLFTIYQAMWPRVVFLPRFCCVHITYRHFSWLPHPLFYLCNKHFSCDALVLIIHDWSTSNARTAKYMLNLDWYETAANTAAAGPEYFAISWDRPQASLTPSLCPWPHRAVAADQPQWILLKANNGQRSSDGCADFTSWSESDLVLIINFNSTHK